MSANCSADTGKRSISSDIPYDRSFGFSYSPWQFRIPDDYMYEVTDIKFSSHIVDSEILEVEYPSPRHLLIDLQSMGESNCLQQRF